MKKNFKKKFFKKKNFKKVIINKKKKKFQKKKNKKRMIYLLFLNILNCGIVELCNIYCIRDKDLCCCI